MILSRLSWSTLVREGIDTIFPKWNTLCLLRSLHLPTLDAALIPPGTSMSNAKDLIEEFATILGVDCLLVRSDGGREVAQYFRGGNTLPLNSVCETVAALLELRRAVILLEPTNRFRNRLAMNFLAVIDGTFIIEVLGPGYDLADLNRVGTPAHCVIYGESGSWCEYRTLSIIDIKCVLSDVNDDVRRRIRLMDIGTKILPSLGLMVMGSPIEFAESWLRSNRYTDLWNPWRFDFTLSQIQSWYEDAFLVANFIGQRRQWKALVLSWSMIYDNRCVYFDVVDANIKFARQNLRW